MGLYRLLQAQRLISNCKGRVEPTFEGLHGWMIVAFEARSKVSSMETNKLWSMGRCQHSTRKLLPFLLVFFLFSPILAADGKVIRIDTHTHYVPPFLYDICISKGLNAGGMRIPKWNVDEHIAFMDAHSIEMSIVSVSTPGARLPFDTVEEGRKLARDLNEYGHMLATTYPERFQFFATLTLPDVEGSVAEAIYALDTLNAAGVILLANAQAMYLGNPKFDPLMDVLDARGTIVFVHPSTFALAPVVNDLGDGEQVTLPTYMVDFMLDTTRAAVNLVRMKVLDRYPNIKFILAHAGGFLPFAAYRVASTTSYQTGESTEQVMKEIKKFYVEVAIAASSTSLASVLDMLPRHHIAYGSDYPYPPPHLIEECIQVYEALPLENETRHEIDFLAANRLFEKPLQYWRGFWHQNANRELEGLQTL